MWCEHPVSQVVNLRLPRELHGPRPLPGEQVTSPTSLSLPPGAGSFRGFLLRDPQQPPPRSGHSAASFLAELSRTRPGSAPKRGQNLRAQLSREAPPTAVREQGLGLVLLPQGWGPSGKSLRHSESQQGAGILGPPASQGCCASSRTTIIKGLFTVFEVSLKHPMMVYSHATLNVSDLV